MIHTAEARRLTTACTEAEVASVFEIKVLSPPDDTGRYKWQLWEFDPAYNLQKQAAEIGRTCSVRIKEQ
jgi:hypothetical protein